MDRVGAFLGEKTPRRVVALTVFLGALYLFRHLAILLVFFVTFERALGWLSTQLVTHAGLPRKRALLVSLLGIIAAIGGIAWAGVGRTIRAYTEMHAHFPDRLAELKEHPLFVRLHEQVGGSERIVEGAKHYATDAITAASAIGHFFIYVLIGFILAVVFKLEEEELHRFWDKVDPRSLFGTLGRWMKHVADATVVTVQLQFIVAACNTAMTLPVLLLLGIPHVGGLMILIFVSALVPVIGNIVSGAILSLLAYQAQGWLGVGIFVGLTFVLHKIESYYLNPRLTARHVHIPGFLLIASLLACEHLFGFKGLFLSFPILFVAGRIRSELREEDAISGGATGVILTDSPDQLPSKDLAAPESSPTGFELETEHITLDSVRPPAPGDPPPKKTKSEPPPEEPVAEP
jgi:predicted PurR-regulated permease PerM